jgi:hypothetical protein
MPLSIRAVKKIKDMKQTAIEYLAEQLLAKYRLKIDNYQEFKQAKEMERFQMEEMYLKGIENYDPTFKKTRNGK